jgi:hypothetical protein
MTDFDPVQAGLWVAWLAVFFGLLAVGAWWCERADERRGERRALARRAREVAVQRERHSQEPVDLTVIRALREAEAMRQQGGRR